MAKIRKINVSEITGDTNAAMPAGTVVVYEDTDNGVTDYVLRVHDGVTNGGVAISPGPGPVIFNGSDGIVRANLNEGIAALFNNGDVYITGGDSLRFTGFDHTDGNSTSVLRFWNGEGRHSTSTDNTELVTLNVGNDAAGGAPTEGFLKIVTEKEVGGEKEWKFDADGVLHLPTNGDILDSNGNSVLGSGSTPNVWVQTFASEDGYPTDVVSMASSVEYDIAGNVIALFRHDTGVTDGQGASGSYYSVAKFTAAGLKLWQVRLSSESTSTYTDGWGLAVDNVDNRIYVAGRVEVEESYNQSSLVKLNSEDGSLIWSNIYDFGAQSDSPVVDVDSEGNPIVVGYYSTEEDTNDGVTVTKIDSQDGSIIWSRLLDGQNDDEAYGMAVGPDNEVVAVGYMAQYDEVVASHSVTPQTGSGANVLVINRSDLSGDTFTDTWRVSGTGITGTIGINAINVYTGLTGTVRQGSGAVFDIVGFDSDYSITPTTAGTNYLPGHKILIAGTSLGQSDTRWDLVLTVSSIDGSGGIIGATYELVNPGFYATGTFTSITGTNYQTGSGLTFDLYMNSDSTYTEHEVNITAGGSNYVFDDVITIPGTQLGGTTPAHDLIATVNPTNGVVAQFRGFSGNAQTTTYRVRTEDAGINFSGTGTWTLNEISTDPTDRMLVVKYDTTGAIQWQKAIQFDVGYDCKGADADIDADGNIYVCGNYEYEGNFPYPASAMNIVKFNSSGVKQWSRRVSGDCEDFAASIVVGPDNNLYLSGVTASNDAERYIMVAAKYSTSGTVIWQRLLENTDSWSFVGSWFMEQGGGSNLAVRDGYVAFGGSFGNLANSEWPTATVIQMEDDGTIFATGDWQISAASFSGTLSSDASDITVVNAGKTDSDMASGIDRNSTLFDIDTTNFLIPTLYGVNGADRQLTNGAYTLNLETTGTLTLPAGGTIKEGVVTSNPTIQLTPANPDVASQKLVIKGGGAYNYIDNGISINYDTNTAIVGDAITFYVYSDTYAGQTLYWWISPSGAGIVDTESGTVELSGPTGSFVILVDSDDYEFTVRVSPEADNYDPDSMGVETGLINPDAPTFDSEHHLHLTTGNLAETSIFLGTDDQNVRTTVNGGIQITTPNTGNNVWTFGTDGGTTFPTLTTTRGDSSGTLTGQTLRFADSTQDVIITTPDGTEFNSSSQRLVINPGCGYGSGEGGDIYLYAGRGGIGNGSGGDIKIRGGLGGGTTGQGGYVDINGGEGATTGGYVNIIGGQGNAGAGGDILIEGGDGSATARGGNIVIRGGYGANEAPEGSITLESNNKQLTLDYTGKTTFPGALVKSTVAKDATSGPPRYLGDSTWGTALVDGAYGPFTLSDIVFDVQVTSGTAVYNISNVLNNATFTHEQIIGTLDSGDLGGTPGTTSNIAVTALVPLALDLTKSINSIGDGAYSLADGVEGQVMYLVPNISTINSVSNVFVEVASARDGASQYSDVVLNPFYYYVGEEQVFTSICTLIYTQDHWQQIGGSWGD